MIKVEDDDRYQPKLGGSRKMKKQSGHAIKSSIMISLCKSTPFRILAAVMPVIMIRAPIMKPWDQASRVKAIDPSGFDIAADDQGLFSIEEKNLIIRGRSIHSEALQEVL